MSKGSKANIPDTQTATFEFGDLPVVWQHRTWGESPTRNTPGPRRSTATRARSGRTSWATTSRRSGGGKPIHVDVKYELEEYPEDKTEKDLERHVAPAIRGHMKDLLGAIASRGRPVADIEQGYISTASCILANLAMKLGRTLTWDPQAGRVVSDDEANRLLSRPYRGPWVHPGQGNS